ncbi:MAG: SprB repeat-containing protein, partial [Bacteroidota bacterium]
MDTRLAVLFLLVSSHFCLCAFTWNIEKTSTFSISNLEFTIEKQEVSCFGGMDGAITISVEGGTEQYEYMWEDIGDNTAMRTDLFADSYTVTITDNEGTSIDTTIEITEPEAITITELESRDISCLGKSASIEIRATGGNGSTYNYSWLLTGSTDTLSMDSTLSNIDMVGMYAVIVKDKKECEARDTFQIIKQDTISFDADVLAVNCNGAAEGSIKLKEVSGGDNLYTFLWNTNATEDSLIGLFAGTYSVTVEDSQGCANSSAFEITEPTAISFTDINGVGLGESQICGGLNDGAITVNVAGGTPDYTYTWEDDTEMVIGQTNQLTDLAGGNYQLTVTDSKACEKDTSFTINELATITIDTLVNDPISCTGASAKIEIRAKGGSGSYTYEWKNNFNGTLSDSTFIAIASTGTYTL